MKTARPIPTSMVSLPLFTALDAKRVGMATVSLFPGRSGR